MLCLDGSERLRGRALIVATGATYRKLAVPRLADFEGVSVYCAATQTEANLCANDPVIVFGGGNSAGQATVFLAQHATRVRLHRVGGEVLGEYLSPGHPVPRLPQFVGRFGLDRQCFAWSAAC